MAPYLDYNAISLTAKYKKIFSDFRLFIWLMVTKISTVPFFTERHIAGSKNLT